MSAVPRPKRQAVVGEIVNYYEQGDPTDEPIPVMVRKVADGAVCSVCFVMHDVDGKVTRHEVHNWVKHIHDEHWDNAPVQAKQNMGAWDFHPVYGPLFDKNLAAAHARAAKETTEA